MGLVYDSLVFGFYIVFFGILFTNMATLILLSIYYMSLLAIFIIINIHTFVYIFIYENLIYFSEQNIKKYKQFTGDVLTK